MPSDSDSDEDWNNADEAVEEKPTAPIKKITIFADFTKEMIESLSLLFDKLEMIDRNGTEFAIHFGHIISEPHPSTHLFLIAPNI
jgi:hypothetical protein